jgi:hypothetical protein
MAAAGPATPPPMINAFFLEEVIMFFTPGYTIRQELAHDLASSLYPVIE